MGAARFIRDLAVLIGAGRAADSFATAVLSNFDPIVLGGCATTPGTGGGATPVSAAMAPRKARTAGPAKGDWVAWVGSSGRG